MNITHRIIVLCLYFIMCLAATSLAQERTESKTCGSCNREVSINSKVGDICPYCGVRWGYESTTTTTSTRNKSIDAASLYNSKKGGENSKRTRPHSTTKSNTIINPFASYSKEMTEQWILKRLRDYSQKRTYCSNGQFGISGCTSYDNHEFKFLGEWLAVKYNFNNEHDVVAYVPIYDVFLVSGNNNGTDFSFNTNSNSIYEVDQSDNTKNVENFLAVGFKNNAEADLITDLDWAFNHLRKYYKKPVSLSFPEFISNSKINRPSMMQTQNWILNKLNGYQQSLSVSSFDGTSSSLSSDFSFAFSGFNLIITYKETSRLKAYGNDNSWKHNITVTIPICDTRVYAPSNNYGVGSATYGGGNFGFISSFKNIVQNEEGRSTQYLSSFDIFINFERENDLRNRIEKAFFSLKTYCPQQTQPKELF